MNIVNSYYALQHFSAPIDINLMWQDTLCHYAGQIFNQNNYREEVLVFSSENIIAPYPNPWGLFPSQYNSLGFYDSTMTYHYDIVNDYTINLTSPQQLYNNINADTNSSFYNQPVPTHGIQNIVQISHDYMVIYGYTPRYYAYGSTIVFNEAFGFIRQ